MCLNSELLLTVVVFLPSLCIDGGRSARTERGTYALDNVIFRRHGLQVPRPEVAVCRACMLTSDEKDSHQGGLRDSRMGMERCCYLRLDLQRGDTLAYLRLLTQRSRAGANQCL